jgi:hypothetical protein
MLLEVKAELQKVEPLLQVYTATMNDSTNASGSYCY